ncbi:lipoyl(octanoyl) transferase LipB [Coxiella endosymbiont of Amblyomma americanum]|uniref:lipoyl(octanoyl) transferase LipB n=1 Tax=Coxiella endosymbiont of Amblyomma americanum TaxID=325775 RepID=UPI000581CB38|nr:lipoyl(octanoyl) transferase LipB [Coxiella endosymbiont of Amblyomma americanum]AJC50517.1 lipoate-protein ligase B [Coxiella endosymbiont of Amblyomma americanum]AUJ58851.1 octanoyltransferase [Coxiella-like endosymbiont of Amblyomma americanum]
MDIILRQFDQIVSYELVWNAMRTFTSQRDSSTIDEIWMLEHLPVFTQGLSGKPENILDIHGFSLIQCDRGGQITYHGPGQIVIYLLLDINRLNLKTRSFVRVIEHTVIDFLKQFGINNARGNEEAPGVYVEGAKICSIGLRVRNGRSYHGLACNVAMDLTPFSYINPCGMAGLVVTQINDYIKNINLSTIRQTITSSLLKNFRYIQPFIKIEHTLEFFTDVKI